MGYSYSSRIFTGKKLIVISVYFSCFLNEKKWFFSYRNNDISCTHAIGAYMLPCEKML